MLGLIIACLVTIAAGAPRGYDYQPPLQFALPPSMSYPGFSQFFTSNYNTGSLSFGSSGYSYSQQVDEGPIVTKKFHVFSAPEEEDNEFNQKHISLGPSRKHYRVVFIKAPSQTSKNAAITISQAQNQDQTIIYVLSKKIDASDIQAHIQPSRSEPSKPVVFFIKYKTPEEAAHAQRSIQAQYDSLGGTTNVASEEIVPVSSVIGSLGNSDNDYGSQSFKPGPQNAYLPLGK